MDKNTIIKMTLLIVSLAIAAMSIGTSGPRLPTGRPAVITSDYQNSGLLEQLDANRDGKVDLIHTSEKGCTQALASTTSGKAVYYNMGCHTLNEAMKELNG